MPLLNLSSSLPLFLLKESEIIWRKIKNVIHKNAKMHQVFDTVTPQQMFLAINLGHRLHLTNFCKDCKSSPALFMAFYLSRILRP